MKKLLFIYIIPALFLSGVYSCNSGSKSEEQLNHSLWYTSPAKDWNEALPIGNGRLGAMVFGKTEKERIQLNDDTFWSGRPHNYTNPGAKEHLDKARELIYSNQYAKASKYIDANMMGNPRYMQAYQPLGDLWLTYPDTGKISEYSRELDLDEAIVKVQYKQDGVTYTREVFSSHPDQSIIIRLTSDKKGALNTDVAFSSSHKYTSEARNNNLLVMQGQWIGDGKNRPLIAGVEGPGMRFETHLKVDNEDGSVNAKNNQIQIRKASAVTIRLVTATSFNNYKDISADPEKRCQQDLEISEDKSYAQMRSDHISDYQNYFNRVQLNLGQNDSINNLPTDERLANYKNGVTDTQLEALYFQFGRYLMISGSRPGSQPLNLQGIWNEHTTPPWGSKYTVNINTEMNYWPAEVTNLSEFHEPLFDMLDDLVETGGEVAQKHYGCRGWVLHHNTDLWRGAAPVDGAIWGMWVTGGAWLSTHLWEHYLFNGDQSFLKERAYPIMKGAARFLLDYMIEHPEKGYLVTCPANSPENGIPHVKGRVTVCAGPTKDMAIIRFLFNACLEASSILSTDESFQIELTAALAKLPPLQIGKAGQLQEWLDDWDMEAPEFQHRHIAHLWSLHPGGLIDPYKTPELAEACKVTLKHRGDGGTGWSKAWKVNFRARLHQGDYAHKMLAELLKNSTHPNLFDVCPPFQIDGNFGGCAGIAEMLLQSDGGVIELLPALPKEWAKGSVSGLRARGRFEISMEWEEGKIQTATIESVNGGSCSIRSLFPIKISGPDGKDLKARPDNSGVISFPTQANMMYKLEIFN
ncbi:glycoside hydrolase family 95 protein [Prolixibacteraceae bacterium Z1-6]|uniref:Glycoside hydrolase family 95 protein n=1 Tax=Draconibacterium aestuarii TaxID=2998507 RepID=A0A9X3F2K0_9BACT|nr:glycoside hydrolase family 95 protein [Prolixibacteraceae bacterium Z1-6]